MTRWSPGTRARLRQSSWDLFGEHGYDNVTTRQIAAAAGVTQRTFFRHFPDKPALLFEPTAVFPEVVDLVGRAEATAPPLSTVLDAYRTVARQFPLSDQRARARQAIIRSSSELRERELVQRARLEAATSAALVAVGQSALAAGVASSVGSALFARAYEAWTEEGSVQTLEKHLVDRWAGLCHQVGRCSSPLQT